MGRDSAFGSVTEELLTFLRPLLLILCALCIYSFAGNILVLVDASS